MGMEPKGKGEINSLRELLLRTCLLGTRVNKGKSEGWATGKLTSNSEKRRSCSEKVETHPTDTLASNDESTMNVLGEANFSENPLNAANFGETPKGEVHRIPLPRTSVNKGNKKQLS